MKETDEATETSPGAIAVGPAGEKELESLVFDPPVYRQRYYAVGEVVKKFQARKVLDFGCAEAKLMRYLISEKNCIEVLVGVDIDGNLLEMNQYRVKPLTSDFLMPRDSPLTVSLYQGSIAEADRRFCDFDVVACVELIEHLDPHVLAKVPSVLLGQLSPRVALVTTPNVEFNILFTDLEGFRHWDHKFEWTRNQFENWATDAARVYGYSVSFQGIGQGPQGTEALGCCSQMAVFQRDDSRQNCRSESKDIGEPYVLKAKADHPYRKYKISEEKQILYELEYKLWLMSHQQEESDDESEDRLNDDANEAGTKVILLEWLLRSPTLSRLCGTIDRLRSVIREYSSFKLNKVGDAILWKPPEPEWNNDEDDYLDEGEHGDAWGDTQHQCKCEGTTGDPYSWGPNLLTTQAENWDEENRDSKKWDEENLDEENWDEENWERKHERTSDEMDNCTKDVCWESVQSEDIYWSRNPQSKEAVKEQQLNNDNELEPENSEVDDVSFAYGTNWRPGKVEPASSDDDWDGDLPGCDEHGIFWITTTDKA